MTTVFENLELRRMLSVSLKSGVLTIGETDKNDVITVEQLASSMKVNVNGKTNTFDLAKVSSIKVTTGKGDDSVTLGADVTKPATITGGDGHDTLVGGAGGNSIVAGNGGNYLYATGGNTTVRGGAGNDTIYGGAGPNVLYGGAGDDVMFGGSGRNTLYGEAGDDALYGGSGPNTMYGDAGNDRLYGGAGTNTIFGGAGDTTIYGGNGNDSLYGGDGDNWIWGDPAPALKITVGKIGTIKRAASLKTTTIYGGSGKNTIHGGSGNNVIYGGPAGDLIYGGPHNNTIAGEAPPSLLSKIGIKIGAAKTSITRSLNLATTVTAINPAINPKIGDFKLLSKNDTIFGNGAGDNVIHGGAGNDEIHGGPGTNRLYAGAGNDTLFGGAGDNTLVSIGGGKATLHRGSGHNQFWQDSNDRNDADLGELLFGAVHTVDAFANGVSHELNGQKLADPQSSATSTSASGVTTTTNTVYENFADVPLFGSAGPRDSDVDQGGAGDCYFLSVLAAEAKTFSYRIKQRIVDLGDGTYCVNFRDANNNDAFVRVDADLPVLFKGSRTPYYAGIANNTLWVPIMEKAWTWMRSRANSYQSIWNGSATEGFTALGLRQSDGVWDKSGSVILNNIRDALNAGKIVAISTPNKAPPAGTPAIQNHVYSVDHVTLNAAGNAVSVTLRNPWGVDGAGNDGSNDGLVTFSANQIVNYFTGAATAFAV